MVDRFLLKLVEQRLRRAEAVLDQLGELAFGLLALRRREALPEKAVVPQLSAVVEELLVVGLLGRPNHLQKRCSAKALVAFDQFIGLDDVSPMVLAMMELERLGRHHRRKRVLGEGEIGKLEGHQSGSFIARDAFPLCWPPPAYTRDACASANF